MLVEENYNNKFDNITPEIVDKYINVYKDLSEKQILLLDKVTREITNNESNMKYVLQKLLDSSINIEYYEGCSELVKIQTKYNNIV